MGVCLIGLLFGMECTKVFLRNPEFKVKIMKLVAIGMFLCGLMLMTVAALYAASLAKEFQLSQAPLTVNL